MTPPPRVSVITIFLNGERFIAEAIASVFSQTYADWELILVNDGSSDRSEEIVRGYVAQRRERVRLVEHPGGANRGMSASRNLGMSLARGEYIALLDSDDVYLPEKLHHQTRLLDANPKAGLIYGATQYWHSWAGDSKDEVPYTWSFPLSENHIKARGILPGSLIPPPKLIPLLVRGLAAPPCTCGILLRKTAPERSGGFEERFRGMFEDQVFFFKVFLTEWVLVDGICLDRLSPASGLFLPKEFTFIAGRSYRGAARLPRMAGGVFNP